MRLPVRLQGIFLRELGATLIADQGFGARWGEKGRGGLLEGRGCGHPHCYSRRTCAVEGPHISLAQPWKAVLCLTMNIIIIFKPLNINVFH